MKGNKVLNVITAIIASILSIVLVLIAYSTVLCSTLSSVARPNTIVDFVQNIDFSSALLDNEEINHLLAEQNLDKSVINDIMQSSAVSEVITLYANDVTSAVFDPDSISNGLTAEAIKEIAHNNIDEIVDIVAKSVTGSFDKAAIKQKILEAVDTSAQNIADMLPPAEELVGSIDAATSDALNFVFGPTLTLIMTAVCAVLAGLIYACRFRRFGGFLWIGVDLGVAGAITALTAVAIKIVAPMAMNETGFINYAIGSASSVLCTKLVWGTVILLLLATLFIVGFALLRRFVLNKTAPVAVAETPSDETTENTTEADADDETDNSDTASDTTV